MSNIEKKMNAIMRCLAAESEEDRESARAELREMTCADARLVPVRTVPLESSIIAVLIEIGVPCHIKGHDYLVSAIEMAVHNPDCISAITKELYPSVAKKHNTTPSRVERAIRHAIECAMDRGDLENLMEYFGNTISSIKGKPTNSEFIARIAQVIRLRRNGEG